jgi:hypothetical protein
LVIAFFLPACSPSQSEESLTSAPLVGPVIPVGEAEVRDLSPTTEVVSNCGSGGGTVIKHPSMSVVTTYGVEWEVGGTAGVGVTIGEGVVPGGVSLSSALEGRIANQLDESIQRTTAWDLPAEPDTVVEYTLMWREVWQPGFVEIRLADESVLRVNVRYRGIQSDIVGKHAEDCSSNPLTTQQPNATALSQTPDVIVQPLTEPPTLVLTGNCPYREGADEINIGNNDGACAAMPLSQFLEIMNSSSLLLAIDALDNAFEANIRIGYQYRQLIPARIPPAPARQRVMWGSLTWIDELAVGEKEIINSRIFRIWCHYTNPCIYTILDDGEFYVGFSGRGVLLAEPLLDERLEQIRR